MKVQIYAAVALLATTSLACMQFGARVTGDGRVVGAVVDNGQTTCQLDATSNPSTGAFGCSNCQAGFSCYLKWDLGTFYYTNGPTTHQVAVQRNGDYLAGSAFC